MLRSCYIIYPKGHPPVVELVTPADAVPYYELVPTSDEPVEVVRTSWEAETACKADPTRAWRRYSIAAGWDSPRRRRAELWAELRPPLAELLGLLSLGALLVSGALGWASAEGIALLLAAAALYFGHKVLL